MNICRSLIVIACLLVSFLQVSQAETFKFCFSNVRAPTYPNFTIDGKLYYSNTGYSIACWDVTYTPGESIIMSSKYPLYPKNVVGPAVKSENGEYCGVGVPCILPSERDSGKLYSIHASMITNAEGKGEGILTLVYH